MKAHIFCNGSSLTSAPTSRGLSAEPRVPATLRDPMDKPREVGIVRAVTLFLMLLILGYWQNTSFASTTVELDPKLVQVNDTFRLILTSTDVNSDSTPNLTALQQDFTILGTERSMSLSMVNGRTSSKSQWIILLRPKKSGKLTIPSIKIGNEKTAPQIIDVSNDNKPLVSTEVVPSQSDGVMLKTDVSEKAPFVNQQVLYTVKLFNNKQLLNAEYHPPQVEDALLIPLGDGRHYQTQIDDQTYSVEEQNYAIFPQKSGALTIKSPSFNAAVYDTFPRRVNVQAKATQLMVRPTPTDYKGKNWLPAKRITLVETYDPVQVVMKEGDTVTRTVTLQAVAMPAQLLPSLEFQASGQFSVYPESPEIKNTVRQNELIGSSTIKVTYLFNQAGQITVPELEVPWFNTVTGKTEITTLPSHTFLIKAKESNTVDKKRPPKKQALHPSTNHLSSTITAPAPKIMAPQSNWKSSAWGLLVGFLLAWIMMAIFWWLKQSSFLKGRRHYQSIVKSLHDACEKNRPKQARNALLSWAKLQWPESEILGLQDLVSLIHDEMFKKQLLALSQVLYDPNNQQAWQGAELWRSFNAYRQVKNSNHKSSYGDLPPINPE